MHNFHHFWIRLTAVLLLIYSVAIANPPEPTDEIKYQCGKVNISKKEVETAFKTGSDISFEPKKYPTTYKGNLKYANADFMIIFPIIQEGQIYIETQAYSYFVVFELFGNTLNVIERTPEGDKLCPEMAPKPLSPTALTPLSSPNNVESTETRSKFNGYKCGQEFFSDVIIKNSVNFAKIQRSQTNMQYSALYRYPDCSDCLLSPIHARISIHASANRGYGSTSFILTDQNFMLRNVVVMANNGAFDQCIGVFNMPEGELRPTIKQGYQCGPNYFDPSYLENEVSESLLAKAKHPRRRYPMLKPTSPFGIEVMLWPLKPLAKNTSKNSLKKWYLVMNTKYQVICAAGITPDILCCENKLALERHPGETKDFRCFGALNIPYKKMAQAAKNACVNKFMNDRKYPCNYSGPKFDIDGPYITWPLITYGSQYGKFNRYAGLHRIVINHNCQIAGVLVLDGNSRLVKCQRLDGTTPGGVSNMRITEITKSTRKKVKNRGSIRKNTSLRSTSTQNN